MNIKKDLKDMGLALITPNPRKFRYEGVDYKRAGRNIAIVGFGTYVAAAAIFIGTPVIENAIHNLKTRFKKNQEEA